MNVTGESDEHNRNMDPLTILFLIFAASVLTVMWARSRQVRGQESRALRLVKDNDTAALPEMIDLLTGATPSVNAIVTDAFTRLLPHINPEDWTGIGAGQRQALCQQLYRWTSATGTDFQLALIQMLDRCGLHTELPFIAGIVAQEAPTADARRIRERARAAMPAMVARAEFGSFHQIGYYAIRYLNKPTSETSGDGRLLPEWIDWMGARLALAEVLGKTSAQDLLKIAVPDRDLIYKCLVVEEQSAFFTMSRLEPDHFPAILGAAERAEDTRALEPVLELASREAATDDSQAVRAAAKRCLKVLEAKAAREKIGQTLLRASSAPEPAADNLLRPASGGDATPSEQLPRAVIGNENDAE